MGERVVEGHLRREGLMIFEAGFPLGGESTVVPDLVSLITLGKISTGGTPFEMVNHGLGFYHHHSIILGELKTKVCVFVIGGRVEVRKSSHI